MDNLNDASHKIIDIMLLEYTKLREEASSIMSSQFTILSLLASALGVLVGIGFNLFYEISKTEMNRGNDLIGIIFMILIPGISVFLGILWLDRVYRQMQVRSYVHAREKEINELLSAGEVKALHWENWLARELEGKTFLQKVNYYYYYASLGTLLLIPPLMIFVGYYLAPLDCGLLWTLIGVGGGIYLIFVVFLKAYIKKIFSYISESDKA